MIDGARVGTVAGIPVRVHWSVALLAWLLSWGLATVLLPEQAPGAAPAAYWAAGLLAALALFGSLLAHELAHALVARRAGMRVEQITLWLLGGVAHLHDDAPDARTEARVAGAGPLVSVVLAAVSGAAALALQAAGGAALLVTVATWLAGINAALALFNLLPGAPLDGGRLLRAWLWRRSGDRERATVGAGRAGRILGLGLVAVGAAEVVAQGDLGGLWRVLLGWFLSSAAQAEITGARTARRLAGVRVGDVMTPDPVTVPSWLTVAGFFGDHAQRHRHPTFPVVAFDGTVDGLLAVTDTLRVPAAVRDSTRVRTIATPISRVPTARSDELLVDVLARLRVAAARRVLVIDDGRLVGIAAPGDLARAAVLGEVREALPAPAAGQPPAADREPVAAGR